MTKIVDAIKIDTLFDQTERGSNFVGGVEDEGNYKEGFCFKMNSPTGGRKTQVWVLCASSLQKKSEWMSMIANLKVTRGGTVSLVKTEETEYSITLDSAASNTLDLGPQYPELEARKTQDESHASVERIDGMWVMI